MGKAKATFKFTARLSPAEGSLVSTVIFLPNEIVEQLPKGRVRAEGLMNTAPFALAAQFKKDGSRYFSVSAPLRKAAKIKEGDLVNVTFKIVDPDKIELPEELQAVLAQDDEGTEIWNSLTPGIQRSLIHYITSVKNVDSRINRSLFLVNKAKSGAYTSKAKKNKKSRLIS